MSEADVSSTEARWRNYQKLIWTQQQIHLQIQQQQQQQQQYQSQKMNGLVENGQAASVPQQQGHHPSAQGIQGELPDKPVDEPPAKEIVDPWEFNAEAAFIGPNLWDKRVPYDGQDFKLEYVDLEEFLTENGIPMDPNGNGQNLAARNIHRGDVSTAHQNIGGPPEMINSGACMPPMPMSAETQMMAGPSRLQNLHIQNQMRLPMGNGHLGGRQSRSPSPCGSVSSGISHDMSSDTSPDSSQTGDMALGSVPGHDFDPRTRSFTEDELKPQPMIKKSRKQLVPDEAKDNKYWARRRKNNMAAKRSRDARRVKENQIAMRACYLEKENQALKQEMDRVQKENQALKQEMDRIQRKL